MSELIRLFVYVIGKACCFMGLVFIDGIVKHGKKEIRARFLVNSGAT